MSVPAFADIAKPASDLINKDYYHVQGGSIEIKSTAASGVAFKTTGKSSHEGKTSGLMEGKYTDKPLGKYTSTPNPSSRTRRDRYGTVRREPRRTSSATLSVARIAVPGHRAMPLEFGIFLIPSHPSSLLMLYHRAGLTLTQTWNTANALESKVELSDALAKGLKTEGIFSFLPASQARGAKLNLHFKQPAFHGRAFFDLLKGPTANIDAVIGHEGFLAGASAGYDAQKAAVTGYSAAVGYTAPTYSASIVASDNLKTFAASYYHKVNSQVEAAAKATWNSQSGKAVGLEVSSKYRLDPVSFAKAKINDRGVAAVAYNVLLRPGVTLGLGGSFDTQKLDQATHKVGVSFTFEG
ncbi:eukaryotic porin/Tom40 [Pseudomassariella vexata]|uniref:Eukaryotic porin/Tom40 n=1 Tax=Pseudomassariella vexata TaxID=1141098 RepID=A0A1Y2EBA2_9PEZI|nr:eukaryotic porin/Tom40 [Pseudomassariella vexata]ORY68848.1 eukaryotic porin/Tom40 [Pseudomassariella vexata]